MGNDQDWGQIGPLNEHHERVEDRPQDDFGGDSFEAGIAAVFEAIRNGDDDADDAGDDTEVEDNGATFALLSELNRLWERPQA